MPLIKSKSKKAFDSNMKEEMRSGKPQDQSLAIAYSVQKNSKKKKKMADGGEVQDKPKPQPQDTQVDRSEQIKKSLTDAFGKNRFAKGGEAEEDNEPSMPMRKPDDERLPEEEYMADHFKDGGDVEEHYASIADAILAKKRKHMSDGGQVDLSINADEEPNNEDQMSFEALKKENYSESEGLDELDQPMDSNEHGHDLEDEDKHDMVSMIRKKIKSRL